MKSQEPSLPVASSVTRMAFFSSRAGSRLFTVKYLLLFMCRSWRQVGPAFQRGVPGGPAGPSGTAGRTQRQTKTHAVTHTNAHPSGSRAITKTEASTVLDTLQASSHMILQQPRRKCRPGPDFTGGETEAPGRSGASVTGPRPEPRPRGSKVCAGGCRTEDAPLDTATYASHRSRYALTGTVPEPPTGDKTPRGHVSWHPSPKSSPGILRGRRRASPGSRCRT